jgi:arabinose-5-phosphate isomerase
MTKRPMSVPLGSMLVDAVEIMAERKISELPVVDADGQPQGMLDITDIVALFPQADVAAKSAQPATLPIPRPKNRSFSQPSRTPADERA